MWSELVEALRAQLGNQMVAGAIALGLVGVAAASLRKLPAALRVSRPTPFTTPRRESQRLDRADGRAEATDA